MTALRHEPLLPTLPAWAPGQEPSFHLAVDPVPPGTDGETDGPAARRALRTRRWPRRLAWAASASLALHGAVVAGLLPRRSGALPVEPPRQEVELVNEAALRRGDAAPAAAAAEEQPAEPDATPAPPSTTTEAQPEPPQPTGPATELGRGGVPMPRPYRPPPPQRQASAAQALPGRSTRPDAPRINLGDEEDREGLRVLSDDFQPPQLDAARRNQPPRYPQDARRRGAQGTVQLRVRVTEEGRPLTTFVARSSGDASLDRSAMEAVMRWHFTPAKRGGTAVPFDYYIEVRFVIGDG